MKVYGDLEKAILEQISNVNPTAWGRGAIYSDITAPAAAVPRYWNGTAWKEFQFVTIDPGIVTQNSGTTCTVDWSTGRKQRVLLTGNCVISFSNPVENEEHILIVEQASGSPGVGTYYYMLNMLDQDTNQKAYQPRYLIDSNRNDYYSWRFKTNITAVQLGTFAQSSIPFTASATGSIGIGVAPSGKHVGVGTSATPFAGYFSVTKTPQRPIGLFGTRNGTSAPTAASGALKDLCYHSNGQFLYTASAVTPFIQAWTIDDDMNRTNALTNPATLPAGAAQCVNLHPGGRYLVVGHTTTPFITAYQLNLGDQNITQMGTKVSDPIALPAAQVNSAKFSPFGDYLAIGSQTSPFLEVYSFTTGFVAKSAAPGTLPTGGPQPDKGGDGIAWRPQGDYIAMSMSTSPYVYVIPFNRATGAFGTPITFTDSATAITAGNVAVAWSPCGRWLYTSGTGGTFSTFFAVYDFTNFTLGANYTNVASIATSVSGAGMEVDPSGDCVWLALNGTNAAMCLSVPTAQKNYLRVL